MREIKFRAIHKLTKKVWNEEELIFNNREWYEDWRAFEYGMSLNMSQCDVMQYTGLKDKNGVEIYEGDVVSMIVFEDNAEYLGDVVFENGCFCLNISLDGTKYKVPALEWKETQTIITVIGNIYENPELLEREAE